MTDLRIGGGEPAQIFLLIALFALGRREPGGLRPEAGQRADDVDR
jgi:hypothetical protein